jgi:Na+-translocating ferredoxin:NAD+ oxidoreductase RnfE subunit
MAPWNVSSDALTIEQQPRRSPSRWLRQNSLRIAVMLGLVEAVVAWAEGFRIVMMLVGVLSVLAYLNVRHRIPAAIRRPIWVVVTAQAVAGILLPAIYVGIGIAVVVGGIMLLILLLVMLGDLRRS